VPGIQEKSLQIATSILSTFAMAGKTVVAVGTPSVAILMANSKATVSTAVGVVEGRENGFGDVCGVGACEGMELGQSEGCSEETAMVVASELARVWSWAKARAVVRETAMAVASELARVWRWAKARAVVSETAMAVASELARV